MARHMQPGWYPDPEESSRFRWWSGTGWTPALTDDRSSPPPPRGLPQVAAGRTFPWVAVFIAVLTVGVVTAVTAIGATAQPELPGGAGRTPSFGQAPTVNPAKYERVDYNRATRMLNGFEGVVSMAMPAVPWNVAGLTCDKVVGLMTSACVLYDASFKDFEEGKNLQPTAVLGTMDPKYTGVSGVEEIAGDAIGEWNERIHRNLNATYKQGETQRVTDFPGRTAAKAQATAEYELQGKKHTVQIEVLVIEIRPGAHLGLITVYDSLMTPQARAALEAAVKTLKVA